MRTALQMVLSSALTALNEEIGSMPETSKKLRWFAGVPVATNPIIVLDVVLAVVVVWLGASIFIGLGQHFIGDGLTFASLLASIVLAGYLALGILAVFFVVGFFILGNKYVALYRIDDRGVYIETMRGTKGGLRHAKPFPVAPASHPKSSSRLIAWGDISSTQAVSGMRVVMLKNEKGGTIAKVYCPTEKMYADAIAVFKEYV